MATAYEINPFLLAIPIVLVVKNVRVVNGIEVETYDSDTTRIWYRVRQSIAKGQESKDIIQDKLRITPDLIGQDNAQSY